MSERPLSPHLQVYRWTLTMAMSILHRITGVALAVGTLALIWLLLAAAAGEEAYNQCIAVIDSAPGQVLLFGWTAALFYHMCNGIRHIFWDIGMGYEIRSAYASGYAVLVVAALLTILVWLPALLGQGSVQ